MSPNAEVRASLRHHIGYKMSVGELPRADGEQMLALLDGGADADYGTLLDAARAIPAIVYHTAPQRLRDQIMVQGLRGALPEQGTYGMEAVGQAHGVYVAREPDERGVWAQEDAWDVWKIATAGLTWEHDRLNPGCWVLTTFVLPDALRLHFSASFEE